MFYILCSRCAAKGLEICEQHLPQALLDAIAQANPYIFIWPKEPEPQFIKTSFAEMIDLSKYEFIYFRRDGSAISDRVSPQASSQESKDTCSPDDESDSDSMAR